MSSHEGSLLLLAGAVADGSHIDWDHAESSAQDPDERHVIRQLRRLAGVGVAARAQASAWGALEIRGEVGSGSFGTVYRAWDTRLEREVALKLLSPEQSALQLASTVIKEGRLLAQIRHPHVVTVYGADAFDGRVGIWMEFLTGRTLKAIVQEQGPFGAHEAAVIGRDLCRALAAVHKQGFLHRDVKAQNVMREAGGRTVLMDFGAGEAAAASESGAALKGSPAYLAPEVLAGDAPSVRSDLYSLGVLLYYLVSGEFPITGESLDALRDHHAQKRGRLLRDVRPDLPASFVRVVDRATSANPAERPESAGAMEALLEGALHADSPVTSGRRKLAGAAVILTAVAAALLAGWTVLPWGSPRPAFRGNSVAILPFKNLTAGEVGDDYFSDGVTADLVAHLAALPDLRVIWGASVLPYRSRQKTATEIGAELGVAAVLDGSVRRADDRVRIVSQLLDAKTGEQLWSESFERESRDLLAMQSEVSRKIAIALKGELSERDNERLRQGANGDFEPFNLYMKGRYYWSLRTEDGLNRSAQFFQDAITLAPRYAPAYAGMADTYTALGLYGGLPREEAFTRAGTFAEKAVALDGSLAEAHASLGYVQKNRFQWQLAEASFKRALELRPGYGTAHHWYSIYLTQMGRFPAAISEARTAISLDPLSVGANVQLAAALLMARRYDDAIAQFERTLKLDAGYSLGYRGIAQAYAQKGVFDRARVAADQAVRVAPVASEDFSLTADIAMIMAMSGRRADALKIAENLADRYRRTGERVATGVAVVYAGLGQVDLALEWLTRATDVKDPEVGYLKVDPRWDPVRSDARFGVLLTRLGLNQ